MKLDIRRKVLLLVLSGSLLTFLLVNIFLYFGLYRIRETVETKNEELRHSRQTCRRMSRCFSKYKIKCHNINITNKQAVYDIIL